LIIVALSGKKDAGKDSGANHLAANYLAMYNPRIKPKVLRMADPLKKFCAQWFGLSYAKLNGTNEDKDSLTSFLWENVPTNLSPRDEEDWKTGPMTHREVLQVWGTDILRTFDPGCHVRRWSQEAKMHADGGTPVLFVTDVRFANEVQAVLDLDDTNPNIHSRIVRLTRDPHEDDHESETALDDFDWKIDKRLYLMRNEGTLAEFKRDLLRWFNHALGDHLD
jgi:hypothetical protein